uniref:Uncharacterized protein n=1 Tax=Anopheles dirus TaxID=7168 RepID=A0A182NUK6_9DIPT
MGWDLPRGYDYFISAEIERTLRYNPNAKSCQFWGVVRSLCCDYYILEVEHREKSIEYCAYRGVIGMHPEIITDIIDGLLEGTVQHAKSLSNVDALSDLSPESLEELVRCVMKDTLNKLELVDTSMLRIRLERIQLEARLNNRTFKVSANPRTKPWQELPPITLQQLEATEGLRVFLIGNLEAPVPNIVKPFDGLEKNLLRAQISKISAHRDSHIDGSETNISLVKCLSGTYGSVIGYNQELLQERVECWSERKEHGMQYWLSETWPGLGTFNDGHQFRCFYIGWALERQNSWYSPVVRIPKMMNEYGSK